MTRRTVLVDAHRGASATHPENTLAAFRAALDVGVDSIEFDVRLSADGCPVVIHDPTVDRTTDGEGEVAELELNELRSLDAGGWKDARFAGERIPTLDQALDLLATAHPRINVELKTRDPQTAETAVNAIEERRLHHRVMVSSFNAAHLRTVKSNLFNVWTHLFLEKPIRGGDWQTYVLYVNSFGLPKEHVTTEFVEHAHSYGKAVWVFTVDNPEEALELAALGIQCITTNDPATIIRALEAEGYR
jgi:glycerophosphoryl diester phosphodiesterase